MKRRNILSKEKEHEDIQAIRSFIEREGTTSIADIVDAEPGPSDDETLRMIGFSRRKQVRKVVKGLDKCDEVNYVSDDYIEVM